MAKGEEPKDAGVDRRAEAPSLSHVQVQMPRELVMNPMKFGKLDNHGRTRKARGETSRRQSRALAARRFTNERSNLGIRQFLAG